MNQVQFRAVLFDPAIPTPERPVQAFFTREDVAREWAKLNLERSSEKAEVWLYEMQEISVGSWMRKGLSTLQKSKELSGNSDTEKGLKFKKSPKSQRDPSKQSKV